MKSYPKSYVEPLYHWYMLWLEMKFDVLSSISEISDAPTENTKGNVDLVSKLFEVQPIQDSNVPS